MSKYYIVLLIGIACVMVLGSYAWMSTSMGEGIAVSSYASSTGGQPQQTEQFILVANDSTTTLPVINVTLGENVAITFIVDTDGTSQDGIDFRSPVASTGPLKPGDSKTVTFTAENSFTFAPYKPSSDVRKGYRIIVLVQ